MKIPRYIEQDIKVQPVLQDPATAGTIFGAQIKAEESQQRAGALFQAAGKELSEAVSTNVKREDYREQKRREAAQAIEHIDRTTAITTGIADMAQRYNEDTDHVTKIDRWTAESRQYLNDQLSQIKDPLVARLVKVDTEKQLMHYGFDIKRNTATQRVNDQQAVLNTSLDQQAILISQAPDPIARAKAYDTLRQMVGNAVTAGIIKPTQGEAYLAKIDDKVVESDVRKDIRMDPEKTLSDLEAGRYPFRDPQRTQIVIDWARGEIQRRQAQADRAYGHMITEEQRQQRLQDRAEAKAHKSRLTELAIRQIDRDPTKRPTPEQLQEELRSNRISPEGYYTLLNRSQRDIHGETEAVKRDVAALIRTTSPLVPLKKTESARIFRINQEIEDRCLRGGEDPQQVREELMQREDLISRDPRSYPRPRFLAGKVTEDKDLQEAGRLTVEARVRGEIDERTEARELMNIRAIRSAIERRKAKQEQQQPNED